MFYIFIEFLDGSARSCTPSSSFNPFGIKPGSNETNVQSLILDLSKDDRGKRKIIKTATLDSPSGSKEIFKYTPKVNKPKTEKLILIK